MKRALYLVNKFAGNVEFALKVQANRAELSSSVEELMEQCEVFQSLEVIKASKK